MDTRLALLLQTFQGLELTGPDYEAIYALGPAAPPADIVAVLESQSAQDFLKRQSDWFTAGIRVWELSQQRGVRWSFPGQPDYPALWYQLSSVPPVFSYLGQPVWQQWPLISIVGSRTPMTETCLWMQRELSQFLRATEIAVVSGGARGVDQWAHRLALVSRRPTVCVFPCGLLNPYPPGRDELWDAILLQDGCLLSTFALHEPMRKGHFHMRNRWIAGLSKVTFVVEGNRRSGSMLTAKFARDEGRDLCTLPVSPFNTQGLGNLDLICTGATPIRDAKDLVTTCQLSCRSLAP